MLTETTSASATPRGTVKVTTSLGAVRYRNPASGWTDVDLTLVRRPDGSVAPRAQRNGLVLSGGGTDVSTVASIAFEGLPVSVGWSGRLPVPVLDGTKATYPSVRPGIDLVVEATRSSFSTVLVVRDRAAVAQLDTLATPIRYGSLVAAPEPDGQTALKRADGSVVVRIPEPRMWDSSRFPGTDVSTRDRVMPVRYGARGAVGELTVEPVRSLLDDPATVFPVMIDPSPDPAPEPNYDAFIQEGYASDQSGSTELRIGTYDGSNVAQSLMSFWEMGFLHGTKVVSASLFIYNKYSWTCLNRSWSAYRTNYVGTANRWSNPPVWSTKQDTYDKSHGYDGSNGPNCARATVEMNVKEAFQATANSASTNTVNLGLRATNEADTTYWKKFESSEATHSPYVELEYDRKPAAPTIATYLGLDCTGACGNPATVHTVTPALRVNTSDPDGGTLKTVFDVRAAASASATQLATNAASGGQSTTSGQVAQWTVPAGVLAHGTTSYWRAQTTDEYGFAGNWSAWMALTIDTAPPATPSVTSTAYPPSAWGSTVGTAGTTFTLVGGADVASFSWTSDGDSSARAGTVPATGTTTRTGLLTYVTDRDMVHTLHVKALDSAGNVSGTYDHQFWVSPIADRCFHWRLDEASGTTAADSGKTDCSTAATGTEQPGTLAGSVAFGPGHDAGNGASFTGPGTISTNAPTVDTNKSFTVTAWVNPSNLSLGNQTIASEDGTTASRFQLRYDGATNRWCFSMQATDSATAPVSACATGMVYDDEGNTHEPQVGVWVHLAGVYNSATNVLQIHVMGNPESCSGEKVETAFAASAWPTTGSFVIGRARAAGAVAESWRGGVDEVYVYPIALSTTKICQLAAS